MAVLAAAVKLLFATARSGLPSPFRSPIAIPAMLVPAPKVAGALKLAGPPTLPVFRNTAAPADAATARSGLPSPLTSPTAIAGPLADGPLPGEKLAAAAKLGAEPAGGVLIRDR